MNFSIHLCITYLHTREGVAERFLDDMRETVAEILQNPKTEIEGSVIKRVKSYKSIETGSLFKVVISLCVCVFMRQAAIYGVAQSIPDRSMVSDLASVFLETIYDLKIGAKKP